MLATRRDELRACWSAETGGHVGLSFTIGGDGAVTAVKTRGGSATLEACLARELGQLRFPATGTEATVRYP